MSDKNRRLLWALMVTYFAHFFSFNLWHTTFNNFAVELFSVNGQQMGLIQSLREIPGFLCFTMGFVILFFSEVNLAALSTVILGAGLIATGLSQNFVSLILSSIFMSVGFHYYYTVNDSLILMVSERERVAHTVGKFGSLGSFSSILAMGAVYFLVERVGYRNLYYSAGGIAIAFGLYMFSQRNRAGHLSFTRKIVFRRKYWLYYILSFLEGSKKHISSTFTIFLLVSVFHVSAKNISLLFMINSIVTTYTHQRFGRIVDKFGERAVLTSYYVLMAGIYLGYGFIGNARVVYGFFTFANVLAGLSVVLNSYFQKIAPAEEITSNVSMRTTIDHMAAIFVPLIGGIVWTKVGYYATFLMGVGIAVAALTLSQFLRARPSPVMLGGESVNAGEENR
ncbi:MAG: MFS transporter [bacterium]